MGKMQEKNTEIVRRVLDHIKVGDGDLKVEGYWCNEKELHMLI